MSSGKADNYGGIPVVDIKRPEKRGSKQEFARGASDDVAKELVDALKKNGFAFLVNHGISKETVDTLFTQSRSFFTLPTETKEKYSYASAESNRGYLAWGKENVNDDQLDSKETMEIGLENEKEFPNMWPTELPEFKTKCLSCFDEFDDLQLDVIALIEKGLGLKPNTLVAQCDEKHENMRLLHYPQVDNATPDHQARLGPHTDYGTLTLILQDNAGGLKSCLPDMKTWVDVPVVPSAILVQMGDMLQRWTNDMLFAPPHKVIAPMATKNGMTYIPERYSIAFFCNANKSALIDPFPELIEKGDSKHYEPVNSFDFLVMRLKNTLDYGPPQAKL